MSVDRPPLRRSSPADTAQGTGSWTLLEGLEDFWAVAFGSPQAGWLVGTEGRIVKIGF